MLGHIKIFTEAAITAHYESEDKKDFAKMLNACTSDINILDENKVHSPFSRIMWALKSLHKHLPDDILRIIVSNPDAFTSSAMLNSLNNKPGDF
jgi:hypothetical protein